MKKFKNQGNYFSKWVLKLLVLVVYCAFPGKRSLSWQIRVLLLQRGKYSFTHV